MFGASETPQITPAKHRTYPSGRANVVGDQQRCDPFAKRAHQRQLNLEEGPCSRIHASGRPLDWGLASDEGLLEGIDDDVELAGQIDLLVVAQGPVQELVEAAHVHHDAPLHVFLRGRRCADGV